jgi:hypothetical protein
MNSSINEETRVRCCLKYRAFYALFGGEWPGEGEWPEKGEWVMAYVNEWLLNVKNVFTIIHHKYRYNADKVAYI